MSRDTERLTREIAQIRSRLRETFGLYADLSVVSFVIDLRLREIQTAMVASIFEGYDESDLIRSADINHELSLMDAAMDMAEGIQ